MINLLQVAVSVILIVLVLLQQRGSGLGALGGGSIGTPYQTKRGIEKFMFWMTIIVIALFAILAILNLVY